jgi:hypothetical protein
MVVIVKEDDYKSIDNNNNNNNKAVSWILFYEHKGTKRRIIKVMGEENEGNVEKEWLLILTLHLLRENARYDSEKTKRYSLRFILYFSRMNHRINHRHIYPSLALLTFCAGKTAHCDPNKNQTPTNQARSNGHQNLVLYYFILDPLRSTQSSRK